MKFDSYTRFLKSDLYRQCVVNEMEGKPLPVEQREEEKREEDEGTSTLKRMVSLYLLYIANAQKTRLTVFFCALLFLLCS